MKLKDVECDIRFQIKKRRISPVAISVLVVLNCLLMLALRAMYAISNGSDSELLVKTTQGPVRGYKAEGENVYIFYGIPYATAPTGPNKFKAPLPPPEWTEPFEAIPTNIICPQMSTNTYGFQQQEDCLIANIYVPNTKEKSMPVVIYIHGGAFQMNFGELFNHKRLLLEHNLVLMNFNYRLGPHGFLCLGTEDIPGNAGMKDQISLLRWVKKNIRNFNGNPNDITVIGYSSGSSSVDLLLLSPLAKGLFNKAVLESGSSLSVFATQSDPIENAWFFANMLNYTSPQNKSDVYALEEFLKSCPYDILFSTKVMDTPNIFWFGFVPCVERDIGLPRFLDDAPLNILKDGKQQKLPILCSFTEMEGLYVIDKFDTWKYKMNEKFSDILLPELSFSDKNEREQVAMRVKKFYFGNKDVDEETIFRYIDYFSDAIFTYGMIRSIRLHVNSGNSNIYLYEYSFVQSDAATIPYTQIRGAYHSAQTNAIADGSVSSFNEDALPKDFVEMKKTMRSLLINFITKGEPVPDGSKFPVWPPVKFNCGPHMVVDGTMTLKGPALQQRALFWDDIYDKHYRTPIPPPTPLQRTKDVYKR